MGPQTELTENEETVLENWILAMASKGFPVHKNNLILSVQKILRNSGRELRYIRNDGTPGRAWFDSFLKRHPKIKQKHAESVSKARAAVTRDKIENWFDEVLAYLKENQLDNILKDADRIFNGDEAGFRLCPSSEKVLGPAKNSEDFYERVASEKEQLTVMATFCANGTYVPPMIIYPYKRIPKIIAESVPENWALGKSDTGWMNSDVFYEYIGNHFVPYLKSENVKRPIIYFVDGLKAHLTMEVSQLCEDHGIILISLFPNTTHITQPADVAVFKPLKSGWTSSVRTWKFENFPKEITRATFGMILKTVFEKYAIPMTIQNGFKKTGLHPFDKNNVDYSKCIPNRTPSSHQKSEQHFQMKPTDLYAIVLRGVEEKLNKQQLDSFLGTYLQNVEWTGDIESENLYKLWRQLKKECETNKQKEKTESEKLEETENRESEQYQETIQNENIESEKNHDVPSTSKICDSEQKENINPDQKDTSSKINILSVVVVPRNDFENRNPLKLNDISKDILWKTPEKNADKYYAEKEKEGFKVPTPFKEVLVFPTPQIKDAPKRKRAVFPSVVSDKIYRQYWRKEQEKKEMSKKKIKKAEDIKQTEASKLEKQNENIKNVKSKIKKPTHYSDSSSDYESNGDLEYEDEDLDISEPEPMVLTNETYVIVKYENQYYPGQILKKNGGAEIKSMAPAGLDWKWPLKNDVLFYFNEDIICTIQEPKQKNNRGLFSVPEMKDYMTEETF
ncbi:hypothetical protein NQ314_009584 [Rhamnusium bicolor]|uniref:HTH CENPB-type domain-containing protein n=1 Tax=Rhamnusium bicolor TaxID=1586634 RepID=A0AAV8XXL7_9CUCU|nr:hypothetical protein NQ314_009584 [Rhamnusium bicolor]